MMNFLKRRMLNEIERLRPQVCFQLLYTVTKSTMESHGPRFIPEAIYIPLHTYIPLVHIRSMNKILINGVKILINKPVTSVPTP